MKKGTIEFISHDSYSATVSVEILGDDGITYYAGSAGGCSTGSRVYFDGEWNGVSYRAYNVKRI